MATFPREVATTAKCNPFGDRGRGKGYHGGTERAGEHVVAFERHRKALIVMPCNNQRGFVLATTLGMLVAITIGAAYLAERVDRSRLLAQQTQQMAESLVDLANTRAEILFRMGTAGFSVYGLGEQPESAIRLDDRPYRGTGDDIVRLQDNRGLLNLNFVDTELLFRLLGQFGVPAEKWGPMLDAFQDYIDTDDLRRLNGAEAREYGALNLPPPVNDWLATPQQLQNIIGSRDQVGLWKDQRFAQLVTASRVTGFNPNTAPLEILASLPGSSREIAEMIVRLRRATPFGSATQLAGLMENPRMDAENIVLFPSNSFRITQQSKKLPWMVQYSVSLTPASEIAPWHIDYYAKNEAASLIENEKEIAPLPARATQSSDRKSTRLNSSHQKISYAVFCL